MIAKYKHLQIFILFITFTFSNLESQETIVTSDSLLVITTPAEKFIKDFGAYTAYDFNFHISDFSKLPGVPNCCPRFTKGSGPGFDLGLFAEIPFYRDVSIILKGGFESGSAKLLYDEAEPIGINGTYYNGVIEHELNVSLSSLGLEAVFAYNHYKPLSLYLAGRADFMTSMTYNQKETLLQPADFGTFENGMRVRNDTSGDIPKAHNFKSSIIIGASYDLPLNNKNSLYISPDISYSFGLSPLIGNYIWSVNMLRIGVALKFRNAEEMPDTVFNIFPSLKATSIASTGLEKTLSDIVSEKNLSCGKLMKESLEPHLIRFYPTVRTLAKINSWNLSLFRNDKEFKDFSGKGIPPKFIDWDLLKDTSQLFLSNAPISYSLAINYGKEQTISTESDSISVRSVKTDLSTNVIVKAFNKDEGELRQDTIRMYETISTNMRPMLNYVFFDINSSKIPARYERIETIDTSLFRIENLRNYGTLETYYKILNIIGRRMKDNPDASILITGYNSNAGVEESNVALSIQRAESVRRYLANVWGIEKDRMKTKGKNLPSASSKTSEKESNEEVRDENRRVEITSEDSTIIKPVITHDTLRYVTPEKIKFLPEFKSDLAVKKWEFSTNYGKNKFNDTSGNESKIPEQKIDVVEHKNQFKHDIKDLNYNFNLITEKDMNCVTNGSIPIVFQTTDSTLDRYSLILFDFDSYKLSDANSSIADFINEHIERDGNNNILGTVEIKGYTDKIGSDSYNLQLSQKRAEALAKFLKLEGTKVSVEGLGETSTLYAQDTPEGRFYCRTVTVVVKNPLKQKK